MENHRHQLTLFADGPAAVDLEAIRRRYNPAQYALIAAHVTLCREDELQDLEQVMRQLRHIRLAEPLRVAFDPVVRFADGRGVLLPARDGNVAFQELRAFLLGGSPPPRVHHAHLTLMHPRNAACTDADFEQIRQMHLPTEIQFEKVHLIHQTNGGQWNVLDAFPIVIFGP